MPAMADECRRVGGDASSLVVIGFLVAAPRDAATDVPRLLIERNVEAGVKVEKGRICRVDHQHFGE